MNANLTVEWANSPPRFAQALTLLFIAAQLWGRIDWPWWWLAAPMWIAFIMLAVDRILLSPLVRYLDRKTGYEKD